MLMCMCVCVCVLFMSMSFQQQQQNTHTIMIQDSIILYSYHTKHTEMTLQNKTKPNEKRRKEMKKLITQKVNNQNCWPLDCVLV